MVNFFKTEIQAYSGAAKEAAVAYYAGELKTAQRSQQVAVIGCATLSRYLLDPFFARQLSDDEQHEVAVAIGELRATLAWSRIEMQDGR